MNRRTLLTAGLAVPLLAVPLLAAPSLVQAQTWPNRPITILVPNPPGGGTDFAARLYQESLARALGVQVVVDNRPGGNGNVAILAAVRAAPDGYTLLMQYNGYHGGNPALMKDIGWDPVRDLAAVGLADIAPHGIFVSPDLPVNTLAEFIAYARARPGQINYASSGSGSIQHIGGVQFAQAIGVEMVHVPYRGAAPALQDVVAGRVQLFVTTPSSTIALVQGGRLKALAIASQNRIAALPEVPTTAEAGLPGFIVDAWFAFFAPASTPAPIIERLNAAMRAATREPDVMRRAEQGGVVLRALTVAETDALAKREVEDLGRTIRAAGITLE